MYTLRTRFKKDIVAEFLPPARKDTGKVIIFCGGMPAMPRCAPLLEFWSKKGFWVFSPRYRGVLESGGRFLAHSPHEDILDVIDELPKGFISSWDRKHYRVKPKKLYLFGSSFGGPAAILAGRDPRVLKVVTVSSVIDWRIKSKVEPLEWLGKFTREAFGEAYRFRTSDWQKLGRGVFYNPASFAKEIDGSKIFLFHAKEDKIVSYQPTVKFAKIAGAKLVLLKRGGHLGSSFFIKLAVYKKIRKFLVTS